MQSGKPYILFCAGEDSGDCIGEQLVNQFQAVGTSLQKNYGILGSGGVRMQNAGLCSLVDFELLPVSGFGDVLPKYFRLRKSYKVLENALKSDQCVGLVAIDYPGFNMKLAAVARKMNKPVLYVAPPQIWAWKAYRAKQFAGDDKCLLAVFFEMEQNAYEKASCNVVRVTHPFVSQLTTGVPYFKNKILVLPGSRKKQMLRNLPVFLNVLKKAQKKQFDLNFEIVILAARASLVASIKEIVDSFCVVNKMQNCFTIEVAPTSSSERSFLFKSAVVAISAPGTATLELALSDCPAVVCTKPDFLTKTLVKRFVNTSFFALPNIILQRKIFPEYISSRFEEQDLQKMADFIVEAATRKNECSEELAARLKSQWNFDNLALEFLAKFV